MMSGRTLSIVSIGQDKTLGHQTADTQRNPQSPSAAAVKILRPVASSLAELASACRSPRLQRCPVSLDGHRQGMQHPFGRIKVGDNPLVDWDRFCRYTERLRVRAEVDDHFLRR